MVVGITGGIGSGKSFVAECFLKYDNTVYYHADAEAKKLMNTSEEIRSQLIEEFGAKAYESGMLNRPYIASLVFNNPDRLQKLNSIVHPLVRKHFKEFIRKQSKETLIIYENAILFEIQSDLACDVVITVTTPKETRIQRVMQRDQVSEEEVLKRMQNQWSDTQKILLSNYIILNISKEATLLKVQKIHNILTEK
jgi:dephospho-CoA kinase